MSELSWAAWREHFERNARRPLPLPEATDRTAAELPPALRASLAESLARFQRGESGEGRLVRKLEEGGPGVEADADYRIALLLLMREEARHARILADWVRALGGRLTRRTWTHTLFVGARRLFGVEMKLVVLLAAEAVGAGFYEVLSTRLPAGPLRDALREIRRDEEQHLAFHCDFFRQKLGGRAASRARFRLLLRAVGGSAAAVVAFDHRRTFEALGLDGAGALCHLRGRLAEVERRVLAPEAPAAQVVVLPVAQAVAAPKAEPGPEPLRPLPQHVAVIMDGNGRWAEQRGYPRIEGHRQGVHAVREVVRTSRELGLKALTLYAFSSLNWQRPQPEVQALMGLLERYLLEERQQILERGIRLICIGDEERLPAFVRRPLAALREASARNRDMTLCLALSYGGREAIVEASRRLARAVAAGELAPDAIDVARFSSALDTAGLPEVDLVIRTSGEQRLSNFLLWETAQAELYFSPKLWPDFDRHDLKEALAAYQRRERRFGLTSAQLAQASVRRGAAPPAWRPFPLAPARVGRSAPLSRAIRARGRHAS